MRIPLLQRIKVAGVAEPISELSSPAKNSADGTLEVAHSVNLEDEPETGEYVTLDDGRRVQVMGYARQTGGQLSYLVVVEVADS